MKSVITHPCPNFKSDLMGVEVKAWISDTSHCFEYDKSSMY